MLCIVCRLLIHTYSLATIYSFPFSTGVEQVESRRCPVISVSSSRMTSMKCRTEVFRNMYSLKERHTVRDDRRLRDSFLRSDRAMATSTDCERRKGLHSVSLALSLHQVKATSVMKEAYLESSRAITSYLTMNSKHYVEKLFLSTCQCDRRSSHIM